jgi:hypothetical protein
VSRWILTVGPCVLGIDWLNSMFDTDLYKRSTFNPLESNQRHRGRACDLRA